MSFGGFEGEIELPDPNDLVEFFFNELQEAASIFGKAEETAVANAKATQDLIRQIGESADRKAMQEVNAFRSLMSDLGIDPPEPQQDAGAFEVQPDPDQCHLGVPVAPIDCVVTPQNLGGGFFDLHIKWTNLVTYTTMIFRIGNRQWDFSTSRHKGDHSRLLQRLELCPGIFWNLCGTCGPPERPEIIGWEECCTGFLDLSRFCKGVEPPDDPGGEKPEPPIQPTDPGQCPTCCCCPCECPAPECPEPEPDFITFCAVRSSQDPLRCYVINEFQEKEHEDDTVLKCFDKQTEAEGYAEQACQFPPKEDDEDEGPPPRTPFAGEPQCDPDWPERASANQGMDAWLLEFVESFLGRRVVLSEELRKEIEKAGGITSAFSPVLHIVELIGKVWPKWFGAAATESVPGGCVSADMATAKLVQAFLGFFQQWFGADMSQVLRPLTYWINTQCPTGFPTSEQSLNAFIAGAIDSEALNARLRMNADCPEAFIPLLEAGRAKLTAGQLVEAKWRKLISDSEYVRELRAQGYMNDGQAQTLFDLGKFIPPIQDLIRFLIRDVDDPKIVKQFQTDALFGDKWQGLTREQGLKQGITDEVAEQYWKAHWRLPSPTQLNEMLHRLDHDDIPDDERVNLDMVKDAYIMDDMLPFWVPKLLAVSYRPINRVDARRAYRLGAITLDQVHRAYTDQGYHPKTADILTDWTKLDKEEQVHNARPITLFRDSLQDRELTREELIDREYDADFVDTVIDRVALQRIRGAHSLRPFKLYVQGQFTVDDFRLELQERFFEPPEIDQIQESADREIRARNRNFCIEEVERRFYEGEIDSAEAITELEGLGISATVGAQMTENWTCRLQAGGKLRSIRQFREILEFGILSPAEVVNRLMRLGWNEDEATVQVAAMVARIDDKLSRRELAEERRIQSEIEKERRKAEQTEKEQQRNLEKLAKAQDRAQELREKRALQLSKAAEKYSKSFDVDLELAQEIISRVHIALRSGYGFDPDTRIKVVVQAVDYAAAEKEPDVASISRIIADETQERALITGNGSS